MAEQLALDERFGDGAAVDRHEGPLRARRQLVQGARNHFLPGAALALDEDGGGRGRDLLDHAHHFLHGRALGDELRGPARPDDLAAQAQVVEAQPLALLGLAEHEQHLVGPEGLAEVVVGAGLHRLDGQLVRAVSAHDDDGELRIGSLRGPHQREAVELRHAHVGDQRVVVARLQLAQRLLAVRDGAHFVAALFQQHRQHVTDRLFVVGDEDGAQGHRGSLYRQSALVMECAAAVRRASRRRSICCADLREHGPADDAPRRFAEEYAAIAKEAKSVDARRSPR